jgi:hypothetical protein
MIATLCCVTSPRIRSLGGYKESTVPLLLCDVIAYAEMCLPSRCLETGCITTLFYCCVLDRVSCGRRLAMLWANPLPYFIGTKNISKKSFRENETCTVLRVHFSRKCCCFLRGERARIVTLWIQICSLPTSYLSSFQNKEFWRAYTHALLQRICVLKKSFQL